MKVSPEALAQSLIDQAHKDVLGQFFIENGAERHIVYIHDILWRENGEIDIKYSSPSENVDKEWLFHEVKKVVNILYHEEIEKDKKLSLFQRFKKLFNI